MAITKLLCRKKVIQFDIGLSKLRAETWNISYVSS